MSENKDWTVMIYMAGDNNLSVDMAYALQEIKPLTAKTDKINLFVYYDGYSANVPTMYCDFSDQTNEIKYYRSSKITDKLIKRKPKEDSNGRGLKREDLFINEPKSENENSASVNSVINFVDWCVNKVEHKVGDTTVKGRKADKYALIFSGHSFGFQNEGLFRDEKADQSMTLNLLRWMFERITGKEDKLKEIAAAQQLERKETWSPEKIVERTSEILGKELAILGFDSCVMSMLEIGCQFKHFAETMVASEGSIPNAGWSYAPMLLGRIAQGENTSSVEVAGDFVKHFIYHQNRFSIADISVDLSAWNLSKLSALEDAIFDMVKALMKCFDHHDDSILYKQMKRILLQTHWECQTYMFDQNIDIGDFCKLLSAEIESVKGEFQHLDAEDYAKEIKPMEDVGDLCRTVIEKLLDCIIISGFSGGQYQYSTGISMFFPWSWSSYKVSKRNYEDLAFVKLNKAGTIWNKFLQKYLGEVNRRTARPLSKIQEDGTFIKDENHSIVYKSYFYMDEIESDAKNGTGDTKLAVNGTDKLAVNGTDKLAVNGSDKGAEGDGEKLAVNGTNRGLDDDSERLAVNGTDRLAVNGTDRLAVNGTDRLLGTLSNLLAGFTITKNVGSFWNHAGYTSKEITFMHEAIAGKNAASSSATITPVSDTSRWIVNIDKGDGVTIDIGNIGLASEGIKHLASPNFIELIKDDKKIEALKSVFNENFLKEIEKGSNE